MTIFKTLPEPFQSGTAVSLGMFDGLHRGHFAVLNAMKSRASGLETVLFTFSTDKSKPDAKTGLHLLSENMRDSLLRDFGVDYIVEPEFDHIRDMSPEQFAKDFLLGTLGAKLVFCGEDFRFGKKAAAGTDELREFLAARAELVVVPVLRAGGEAISTTRIRGLIQNGEVAEANELLGRPFAIDFIVEHGRKLGRTWGLPTINQAVPASFVVPKFGVYASVTVIDGVEHVSVTNVGVKPTVGSNHILAETYIHEFSGDLYGQSVPVRLVQFIRGEKKFDNVEELRAQIEADNRVAGELLKGNRRNGNSMTCRDEILIAVRKIIQEKGVNVFTIQEVLDYMIRNETRFEKTTIRTHIISRLCVDAPNHHSVTYDDFKRLGNGNYKLL